jgi:hypothetical protein
MNKEEPEDEWDEKKKGGDSTIRESALEGDESSEYIQGAILEASKSEEMAAESTENSRAELWFGEKLADSKTPELLYHMNPFNYDRIDWIFSASFFVVVAGGFTLFFAQTFLMTIASLVGMFLAFCTMLLCVGIEDLLKDGVHRLSLGDTEEETEEFEGGESFEQEEDQVRKI